MRLRHGGQLLAHGRARPRRPVPARSTSTAGRSTAPTADRSVDEDRYLEFWNLVFMQDELGAVRSQGRLRRRAARCRSKNIDTGMGLERVAYLLQGVDNLYEIDEVYPVLDRAAELAGKRYGAATHDRRRAAAGRRRPRAQRADADQRRRHARATRRAATCCAGCCAARSARCGCSASRTRCCPSCCRSAATRWRRPTPSWRTGFGRISPARLRRGGDVPADAARRHHDPRHARSGDDQDGRAARRSSGDARLPAARHLRLPDRPDPRDGRRAGPRRSTRRASAG